MTTEAIKAKAISQLQGVGYTVLETNGIFDIVAIRPTGLRFIKVIQADIGWTEDYRQIYNIIAQTPHHERVTYEIWVYSDEYEWLEQTTVQEGVTI